MRFAYINSQGKEVAIPSVEALQLRIELGAITSATMFYDVSADKWAPAEEHDIFRTLQRELTDKQEGVYVAPPPPPLETPPAREAVEAPAVPEPTFDDTELGLDRIQLIPADLEGVSRPPKPSTPIAKNPFEEMGFELTPFEPLESSEPSAPPEPSAPLDAPPAPRQSTGFDFGERNLPETHDLSTFESAAPASSGPDFERRPAPGDFGSAPPGWAAEIQFEEPLSASTPDAPPSWMQQLEGGQGASTASERRFRERDTDAELEFGTESPAEAPARPEPPLAPLTNVRFQSTKSSKPRIAISGRMVGAVVLVGLIAGGGWFGVSRLRGRVPAQEAPPARTYEPVAIPALAAELEPTFHALAPLALRDAVGGLEALREHAGLPAKPNADWLSGRYLAGASGFSDVADYWNALGTLLAQMRSSEEDIFRNAVAARMDSMAVPAEARASIEQRALAGFRSTLPDRDTAYDQLGDVIRAATGLHSFLLSNEDKIDYEPAAAGISRDPVLEAVPLTKQLGDEMWGRVDGITAALEVMGALGDREGVTTQGLLTITLRRLAETTVP